MRNISKIRLFLFSVIVIFIDMLSKVLIKNFILFGEHISIIKDFLYLTYVKNTGAAFSIFEDSTLFLVIVSIIIILGIIYYIFKHDLNKYEILGYGMVIGGAFGNLFDRVVYGYVIDFIDIYIFGYDYPVFNVADMGIVIGVVILFIGILRGDKNEFDIGNRD